MGACLYGGYRRKIYPLYSVAYITSSLSKEWERAFLWVSRKIFFYGINFDAAARFALEGGIKIDATRLKPAFVLAFWRQNGANCRCFLTSGAKTEPISCETSSHHPTATFEPPKRHWFWDFLKILFERSLCRQRETVLRSSFYPLTATWRAKNDTGFQNISLLNYRSLHPSKNDTGFLLFFWGGLQ